jgi:hypothetical protein
VVYSCPNKEQSLIVAIDSISIDKTATQDREAKVKVVCNDRKSEFYEIETIRFMASRTKSPGRRVQRSTMNETASVADSQIILIHLRHPQGSAVDP